MRTPYPPLQPFNHCVHTTYKVNNLTKDRLSSFQTLVSSSGLTGSGQADWVTATKMIVDSIPGSSGHFSGRQQLVAPISFGSMQP